MSFKRIYYTALVIAFASSFSAFKSSPILPLVANDHSLILTDTLPDDMQQKVREMNAKREEIRAEVARIKMEQEAYARKRQEALEMDAARKAKKSAKQAQKTDPAISAGAEQARLEQIAAEKARQKAAEQEARRIAKAQKKVERAAAAALAKKEAEINAAKAQISEAEQSRLDEIAAEKARQKAAEQEAKRIAREQKKAERAAAALAKKEAEMNAQPQFEAYKEKPAKTAEASRPEFDPAEMGNMPESERIPAESVSLPAKPQAQTPAPATSGRESDKTKKAVAKAMAKKKKKSKNKNGLSAPTLSSAGSRNTYESSDLNIGECQFAYNEIDPFTQRTKRRLTDRFFFSYTEEQLKVYMAGEDYLICNGSLSDIQGILALNVEFVINSAYARQEYGGIGVSTQLIFKMIDGETLPMLSEQSDSGIYNKQTGKTTYKTLFLIGPKDEKILRKKEISEVRMVWGTGYEDYEVNELDFLIDQFHCIDAARN